MNSFIIISGAELLYNSSHAQVSASFQSLQGHHGRQQLVQQGGKPDSFDPQHQQGQQTRLPRRHRVILVSRQLANPQGRRLHLHLPKRQEQLELETSGCPKGEQALSSPQRSELLPLLPHPPQPGALRRPKRQELRLQPPIVPQIVRKNSKATARAQKR